MRQQFSQVRIESVSDNMGGVSKVGQPVRVEATVVLGSVQPGEVSVQMFHGPLDGDGQLNRGSAVEMTSEGQADGNGRLQYVAEMPCERTGLAGYTVRVVPRHEALPDARDMGLIRWA